MPEPLRLHIVNFGYSRSPWRLAWCAPDGTVEEIHADGLWWERKKDALPIWQQLAPLGLDWGRHVAPWTEGQKAAVRAILMPLIEAERAHIAAITRQEGWRG